jgi:hypothetical protein
MVNTLRGNQVVAPDDLMDIPVGSIILVGKALHGGADKGETSVWFVFAKGKAAVIDEHYPHSETEDLDWFVSWEVTIVGKNEEYVTN